MENGRMESCWRKQNGDISIIKHKGNKIELYVKGHENIEAWQTYDIENIDNITFTVFIKETTKKKMQLRQ